MNITSFVTVPLTIILWKAIPLVFAIAFFHWWRRLKHWSFAMLSAAASLYLVAQIGSFLLLNMAHWQDAPAQQGPTTKIIMFMQVEDALQLILGIMLIAGAWGMVSAAKDDFLLADAAEKHLRRTG